MSIWSAIFAARRAADPKQPADRRIPVSNRTLAGVVITADNCITVPTVWACLRYLSQTTAVLPWRVMRPGERGSERADKHPVDYLLNTRPNPEWSAFQFRESLVHWALRWGNGYAEIERDTMGRPIALWPIHPARVQPMRDPEGALFFRVDNGSAMPPSDIDHADMFHVRGFGEGVIGINLVEYAAESIGWARAAQLFGAGFFGQGMNVAGVIESKKPLSETGLARLKSQMARLYRGVRGERVMYLDAGMEFKAIGMEPNKGQFLETNMYLVEEICRWFGVPPHKVAHLLRSTNNNVESQVIEVVVDSVGPWVKRFEDEANYKLFGQNRQGFFTKMNMNALMRGDPSSRATYYKVMREIGAMSADDIRGLEDMNPLPEECGGDKYVMQSQYTTLEQIGEMPEAVEPGPDPEQDMEPEEPEDDPEEMAAMAGIRDLETIHASA